METTEMGKVLVTATIENLGDLYEVDKGRLAEADVRRIEVEDALIDTGAVGLMLPARLIASLGLKPLRMRPTRGIGGHVMMPIYSSVRLTIQGRDCPIDVGQVGDDMPVIVGVIPLEWMDWIVDPKNQRLIGNPAHGGEWMQDAFGAL